MGMLKRQQGFAEQIPADVRERARRAGAEDLDWYGGRLDVGDSGEHVDDTPAAERDRLVTLAEQHRTESAGSAGERLVSPIRSLTRSLGRLLSPSTH